MVDQILSGGAIIEIILTSQERLRVAVFSVAALLLCSADILIAQSGPEANPAPTWLGAGSPGRPLPRVRISCSVEKHNYY